MYNVFAIPSPSPLETKRVVKICLLIYLVGPLEYRVFQGRKKFLDKDRKLYETEGLKRDVCLSKRSPKWRWSPTQILKMVAFVPVSIRTIVLCSFDAYV